MYFFSSVKTICNMIVSARYLLLLIVMASAIGHSIGKFYAKRTLTCKCWACARGSHRLESDCTNGLCQVGIGGVCRKRTICKTQKLESDIGHPSINCLENFPGQYTFDVFDCIPHLSTDRKQCLTRHWHKEAIGCCSNSDRCNADLRLTIDGFHSNQLFFSTDNKGYVKRTGLRQPPADTIVGVFDGYPCRDVSDCRSENRQVWCQNKWYQAGEINFPNPQNMAVCCSRQVGLPHTTSLADNDWGCCGSGVVCSFGPQQHCRCVRGVPPGTVISEKADGSACTTDKECAGKICRIKDGTSKCCTGENLGSHCSVADGILCCGDATTCENHLCITKGPGSVCDSATVCKDSECRTFQVRTGPVLKRRYSLSDRIQKLPPYLPDILTSVRICCKGNLGDQCPTCGTKDWQFVGPCYGCCEGITCFKGQCSNLRINGETCEIDTNCHSRLCRSGYCCSHEVTFTSYGTSGHQFSLGGQYCHRHRDCCRFSKEDSHADNPELFAAWGNKTACCDSTSRKCQLLTVAEEIVGCSAVNT